MKPWSAFFSSPARKLKPSSGGPRISDQNKPSKHLVYWVVATHIFFISHSKNWGIDARQLDQLPTSASFLWAKYAKIWYRTSAQWTPCNQPGGFFFLAISVQVLMGQQIWGNKKHLGFRMAQTFSKLRRYLFPHQPFMYWFGARWFGARWFGFRLDPRMWKGLVVKGTPLVS